MSAEEKVAVLTQAVEEIRVATFAEFQEHMDPRKGFNRKTDICPVCGRASTAEHLKSKWALIQSVAARVLRETEEES